MESRTKPFLKWAGGKGRLLEQLRPLLPSSVETYFEPFLGGGAMFFDLQTRPAMLSDVNPALVRTYKAVQLDVERVISYLESLMPAPSAEAYAQVRARYNQGFHERAAHAAHFIWLNRLCFNGLHRVNKRGHFNVPYGRYKNPRVLDSDGLRACSKALQGTVVREGGFEIVLEAAREGDFVYLDPPYVPVSETASFTAYAKDGFGPDEQIALLYMCRELDARGVRFMLSNSNSPSIHALYAGLNITEIKAPRSIAAKAGSRSAVGELVIRNYGPGTRFGA